MLARLILLFTLVPLLELLLLVQVGRVVGLLPTVALVLFTGVLGAWLTRLQGLRVWRRVREQMNAGQIPTQELLDGLLVLLAGAVLLTPGLITDAAGFVLLVPRTRAAVRRRVSAAITRRLGPPGPSGPSGPSEPPTIDASWRRFD